MMLRLKLDSFSRRISNLTFILFGLEFHSFEFANRVLRVGIV